MRASIIYVFCFFCAFANAQNDALSPGIANYRMYVSLDTTSKKLYGQTRLEWTNISDEPVYTLHFHMYYNAFKSSRSTFMMERGVPAFLTRDIDEICGWGWTHIDVFRDQEAQELTDSMYYYQPDDNNPYDQTVLVVNLAEPVAPGETQQFSFDWTARIPKTMPRTGYNKSYYFMAQWFPKLGVLEPAGMRFSTEASWNCHQYHSTGEYYSDFGHYEVFLDVPADYEVAATGLLEGQEKKGDRKIWHFTARDVIDFTWSCSPHFEVFRDKAGETDIYFYTYPYKAHVRDRYFNTIRYAIEYLEKHLGPYPYKKLSIIDPPIHGMFTGGMEYPMLVTSLSFCFFPEGLRTPETLVVHEFIHQYFMQMVASNETEEAWMDEGITSYYESRILDSYLGENSSTIDLLGLKTGNKTFNRVEYFGMDHPAIASNAINSWEYKHGGYGEIAYNKAALWLQTLEGLVGIDVMDKIMRSYFESWRFRHPCRQDFIDVVNEISSAELPDRFPEGMDWFFEQVLYGTGICDYAAASIDNTENEAARGFLTSLDSCIVLENTDRKYTVRAELHRLGELQLPQEILLIFENGTESQFTWDGKDRAHAIELPSDVKLSAVIIDPDRKIYMDRNFINNSLDHRDQAQACSTLSNRIFTRLQSIFELISLLI